MKKTDKIFVAGHNGLVGSELVKTLKKQGYNNIITANRSELNLLNQIDVQSYLMKNKPDYVFNCAAKVGGIHDNNTKRAEYIYENIMIQSNLIHWSYKAGVKKFLFLGSSCIYPKNCPQPIKEEYLLTSELEKTNEPYAIAKISGVKMIESYNKQYNLNYLSVMPTNLYGSTADNYDLETSHVFAAMIRKFRDAVVLKHDKVVLWGDGSPYREFMHVSDLADALIFLMNNNEYDKNNPIFNIGTGKDITIKELAEKISNLTGFKGEILWDDTKPNGTYKKQLDTSKINELGWFPKIELDDGIETTIELYKELMLYNKI